MESHPCYQPLIEMGCSHTLIKASIRSLKTEDLSALIDWISDHSEEETKWAKWLQENKETGAEQEGEGQSIDHLVNAQFVGLLMSKGHSKNVSQKALLLTSNTSVESADKWIEDHKFDADFEEELRLAGQAFNTSSLTPEEAKQKLKQLTEKAREIRKKREEEEERERQKNRVKYGKEMVEAKKIAEELAMKRKVELDKIQKQRDQSYKKKLLDQMKRERNEKLGIKEEVSEAVAVEQKKKPTLSKIEQLEVQCEQVKVGMHAYPQKAKVFFETAGIYVGNILKNNGEEKFRKINKENKAFLTRVTQVFGGVETLQVIGYEDKEGFLVLTHYDAKELQACANLLQRYIQWYN